MEQRICEHIHPGVLTIQAMLRKIDRLRLPIASRRDVESILVRQVSKELDRALPWQTGHGCKTAAISWLIGQAVGLTSDKLHHLKLVRADKVTLLERFVSVVDEVRGLGFQQVSLEVIRL